MAYLIFCFFCGLAGAIIGKIKGSSFFLWFMISAVLPIAGIIAAVLYRVEHAEPRRICPVCGATRMLYDAVCTKCGEELDFPDESGIIRPTVSVPR